MKMTKAWVASLAAVSVVMGGIAAQAADLGGNCCADLEERVAELEATTARKGNRKVTVTVYGQVNKAITHLDVFDATDTRVIDNGNSQSRFGFRGEAKVGNDMSIGFQLELGASENSFGLSKSGLEIRQSNVYAQGTFGKLTLGQASFAGDGAAEISLANTPASTLLSLGPFDSAYLGTSLSPFDSGRGQIVRYDTPTIGGFVLSAAWGASDSIDAEDAWDVALRYANEFQNVRVAAAIAYRDTDGDKAAFGSASIKEVTSGVFLSGSAGKYEVDGISDDVTAWHVQGGIERKMSALGDTTLYVEYGNADIKPLAIDGNFFGFGVTQEISAAATSLYAGARFYDVEGENATAITAGAVIKF